MARLLESQALDLLRQAGLTVPRYEVAREPREAEQAALRLGGPVVVKALVPAGKRGRAGGILFAGDAGEAARCAEKLLGTNLACYPVEQVLVEERLDVDRELYLAFTIASGRQATAVIAGSAGGMDVEELSRLHPEKVRTIHVDPLDGLPDFAARQLWYDAGVGGSLLPQLGSLTARLHRLFVSLDAYILEVNPLVVTREGKAIPAAVLMGVDDAAVFRHSELAGRVQPGMERTWRPLTGLEKQVVAVNDADPYRGTARYTEMEGGDIGFLCGGGGASLLLFDALRQAGGRPANYSEVGGNPTADKVYGIARAILSKPGVRGLLVAHNITNNTQVDLVAEGVVRALDELGLDARSFPVVAREAGVNEERARRLFQDRGVEYYGDEITLAEAARRIVARVRECAGAGSEVG
ncbi:MAG: ATP-grasp domain-containing protein [Bacillota bacterium]|nr:ATP citrate lyase citrate-binding domain-containing protein [Bacillota bacterium]